MKVKILILFILSIFLFRQDATAQNTSTKTSIDNRKPYPNPYDNPVPNKPVEQDPFTWEDFPININNYTKMNEAYKEALKNNDGYKILQLAKIELENVYTYGSIGSTEMLLEAYNIALHNKDPFLALYVTQYDSEYNLFGSLKPEDMMKNNYEISLERKDVKALYKLADIEERENLSSTISPREIRMKALFINNKNFAPYPNPYDNPDPNKPLDRPPFIWKDYPSYIRTSDEINHEYKKAVENNDGYRLLQLAKVELNNNYLKELSLENILERAYNIGLHNKDPYLLLYISLFEEETNVFPNLDKTDIFRKAYEISIERRDLTSFNVLYSYEKFHNFLLDVTLRQMLGEIEELKNKEPLKFQQNSEKGL